MELTMATANLWLYHDARRPEPDRWQRVEEMLRMLDADVIAVQELLAAGETAAERQVGAERVLLHLAEQVGMCCEVDGEIAAAAGAGRYHTGLLWRPETVTAWSGSVSRRGRESDGLWHSLTSVVLEADGAAFRVGSFHAAPFSPPWRLHEAYQVLAAMYRDKLPGLIGGDWNSIGAETVPNATGDGWCYYDEDPYRPGTWHPVYAHQRNPNGRLEGQLDRGPAEVLERLGGMQDCAVMMDAPWLPTTGHHPEDPHPRRRIDRWYATSRVGAVTGYGVTDPELVGTCSDHLPVLIRLDTDVLT